MGGPVGFSLGGWGCMAWGNGLEGVWAVWRRQKVDQLNGRYTTEPILAHLCSSLRALQELQKQNTADTAHCALASLQKTPKHRWHSTLSTGLTAENSKAPLARHTVHWPYCKNSKAPLAQHTEHWPHYKNSKVPLTQDW